MANAKKAVKRGVVAPIAWLKDIGMYFNDRLPRTIVVQNMVDKTQIFHICFFDFNGLIGVSLPRDKQYAKVAQAIM